MAFSSQGPYLVGVPVHVTFTFQKIDLSYGDPTTITYKYMPPGQPRTTIVTPDARIVKDAVGQYHVDLDTTGWSAGRCIERVEAAGAITGAEDGQFVLKASPLSP